jgi:hypothetical protein
MVDRVVGRMLGELRPGISSTIVNIVVQYRHE